MRQTNCKKKKNSSTRKKKQIIKYKCGKMFWSIEKKKCYFQMKSQYFRKLFIQIVFIMAIIFYLSCFK